MALLLTDNNGVVVELPSIPASGAVSVTGSLIFGIGTQSNNGLGSAQVLTVNTSSGIGGGTLTTLFNGQSLNGKLFRHRVRA